jgi:antitoxin MazE
MSTTAKFRGTVQPWGNSLGIRITRPMSDMARLGKGDQVAIEVTEEGLLIRRSVAKTQLRLPYTETELLDGMTEFKAHSDELPTPLDSESGD